ALRDPRHIPEHGLKDVRTAISLGPDAADLRYVAACLCALSAEHKEPDGWITEALEHVAAAIRVGFDPRRLHDDAIFDSLHALPAFNALLEQPAPGMRPRESVRLVDPCRGPPD